MVIDIVGQIQWFWSIWQQTSDLSPKLESGDFVAEITAGNAKIALNSQENVTFLKKSICLEKIKKSGNFLKNERSKGRLVCPIHH